MKHTLLFALLFTLSTAIGQNTEAVSAYLGAYRFDKVAPPAGPVEFVFSTVTLHRQADGKATFKTILKKGLFEDSGKYGTLSSVRITENGRLVPVERYTPAKDETGMLTRASVQSPDAINIGDSASIASGIDRFRDGVEKTAKTIGPVTAQIWGAWMWFFKGYLMPFLVFAAILLLLSAGIFSSEALISHRGWVVAGRAFVAAHAWSSFLLACDILIIFVTLLAHTLFYVWVSTGSVFWMSVIGLLGQWILRSIAGRLIPNLPVAGTKSGAKYTGGGNAPQLNG